MKGNWKDTIEFNFLDAEGYLTEDAKDYMKANDLKTLEEALSFVELQGKGYWFTNDLGRPDVHYSGHVASAINAL